MVFLPLLHGFKAQLVTFFSQYGPENPRGHTQSKLATKSTQVALF
jgi:hypothetical protein